MKDSVFNLFNDFKAFLEIMLQNLVFLTPETPAYKSYIFMMESFGKTLVDDKFSSSVLFLEGIGLDYMVEFAKKYSNKKDALASIIMTICPEDDSSIIRLLRRLETLLGPDLKTLGGLLAHMSVLQSPLGFKGEILDFYWSKAVSILHSPSPKMKVFGLKILNEISLFNYLQFDNLYATLRRLCQETWWEIPAQILIICSNLLEVVDMANSHEQSQYKWFDKGKRIGLVYTTPRNMEKRLWRPPSPRLKKKPMPPKWKGLRNWEGLANHSSVNSRRRTRAG